MDGSRRLAWLEDYAAALATDADLPVPDRLTRGHPLRARVVRLPRHRAARARGRVPRRCRPARSWPSWGRTAPASPRSSSCWPSSTSRRRAASSSTAPTWPACRPTAWRDRLAGAFQDFFRFELRARHSVGVGDVPRLDDEPAVVAAVERAGADDVVGRLGGRPRHPARPDLARRRRGRASGSGRSWPWPVGSCATSRCCSCSTSRPRPSTPRPSTPSSSATRPAPAGGAAKGASPSSCPTGSPRCAWPTSSSCSTAPGVVEVGSHEELMADGGQYAELYDIQAAAYR